MTTTHDLICQARSIARLLDSGEATADDVEAEAVRWLLTAHDKLEALMHVHRALEADAAYLRDEERRLAERRRVIEAAAARVRDLGTQLLIEHRELTGEGAVKRPTYSARLARGEAVVGPDDAMEWPEAYRRVSVAPDRAAAKAALKAGVDVPGVALVVSESVVWR